MHSNASQVLDRIVGWARDNDLIRAVILEGSRANPSSVVDAFSDYDVAFVVSDRTPFVQSDAWQAWYGERMVSWGDNVADAGIERTMRLVLYADGTRIDYCIWTPEALTTIKERGRLPAILDTGYRVLFDKDGITGGLRSATTAVHIPRKPDEATFLEYVDDFWIDAAYVAKNLCRDQLLPTKYGLNTMIGHGHLRRLFDWRMEIEHDWKLPAGRHGRSLRNFTPESYWRRLESLFVGAGHAENWDALSAALDLHRQLATEVAGALGFNYPHERDKAVTAYLQGQRERDEHLQT